MHVALLQLDLAWQDASANRGTIEQLLRSAALPAGSFAIVPEMADTGFVPRVAHDARTDGPEFASRIAREFGIWFQHGCTTLETDGFGRNEAIVADPSGVVRGIYRKVHPFGYGAETAGFRGGDELVVIDTGTGIIAPFICYDLRFPEVWRLAALAGAEVFMLMANWPAARHAHWRALCISRAIENQAYVVACNRVGADPAAAYSGGSLIISPQGEVVAEADATSQILRATVNLEELRAWRNRFPALRDLRRQFLGRARCVRRDSQNVSREGH